MEAKELRIGNIVTDKHYETFKGEIVVDSISEKGVNLSIDDDGRYPEIADRWIEPEYTFDELRGIPITEEWLKRFGFTTKMDFGQSGISIGRWDLFWKSGRLIIRYDDEHQRTISIPCDHIHTLQNAVFALTGEELTLKNK